MPGSPSSFAFKNFDSLVDTIGEWLARDDLASQIPDFIWLCECEIQREVHFRTSDKTATGTSVADQEYIDLPTDYVEGRFFQWDANNDIPITVVSWDILSHLQKQHAGGRTRAGVVHGTRLYVAPTPGASAYTLHYKAGVSHLSATNQSNVILVEHPDLLLYGALKHSAPYLGADERMMVWASLHSAALASVRQQEARSRTGHGPLYMRPDVGVL